ncbi:hypothetical protein GCM10028827_23970 [Mucilaginibacter myungsuensis]
MAGCKKETFDDISFAKNVSAPAKISTLFNITQDNTGLVTITPAGEGAINYDVYFGDGTTKPTTVAAGKNVQHTYAEGNYTVKITAKGPTGQTTDFTQPLTVSFRAPENLKTTVSANGLVLSVSASATYETMFRVYFGDSLNVTPLRFATFLEGQTITHNYPGAGTYNVRIIALSGGKATTETTQSIKVGKQIDLPVTFDDPNFDLTTSDFGGNASVVAADPTNAANKVLKITKGAETWAGTTFGTASGFATKVPLATGATKMSIRVYSPAAGLTIKLKLEDHLEGTHAVEADAKTTVANAWETLNFDLSNHATGTTPFNPAWNYDKASVFFDFGTAGAGKVFYADDLKFIPSLKQISLPVTFDDATVDYATTDFGNNATVTVADPANAANKVKQTTKPAGAETWSGTTLSAAAGLGFSAKVPITPATSKMTLRVYAPAAGITVKLKLEDHTNGTRSIETDAVTTVANGWETLTFDFNSTSSGTPAYNAAYTYDKASVFFDFGVTGSGKKFYWDDLKMAGFNTVMGLPFDFESTALVFSLAEFDGGALSIVANPQVNGINTSTRVAKMVKNNGQTWGGGVIVLPAPIDFSGSKIFKVKVWSPRVGAKFLLKVENMTNGGISFEKEGTATVANAWETLTFDYSGINTTNSYQKIVVICDNGTKGDGTANYTWLFDDITL